MNASEVVKVERHGDATATITVNRPQVKNALNIATRAALAEAFSSLAGDAGIRAIVLTGGPSTFVAGADINEFLDETPVGLVRQRHELNWQAISSVPQPVVAAVTGFALGGGMELAMSCDIIVAGEGARFGQPEVKIGIMPGAGGTQRLTRAAGKFHAMRMILTGDMVTAAEAHAMGIASLVVPDADVESSAKAIAQRIAALPPLAVQAAKQAVLMADDVSLTAGLFLERKAFEGLFATADKREGMKAFLEKRKAMFTGE
jgi:enoyl-CoA hydratase